MNLKNYLLLGCCFALGTSSFAHDRNASIPQRPGVNPRTYAIVNAKFQELDRMIRNAGGATAGKTAADPDRVLARSHYVYAGGTGTLADSTSWTYSGTRGSKFSEYLLNYGENNPMDVPAKVEGTDTYVNFDTMMHTDYTGANPATYLTTRTYDASNKVQKNEEIGNYSSIYAYNAAGKLNAVTIIALNSTTSRYDSVQKEMLTYNSNGYIQQRGIYAYDSMGAQWINLANYNFITNNTGQILTLELEADLFGTGMEPLMRYSYNYGPNGKFVRAIQQQYDGTAYVNIVKDSVGYSGNAMVYEDYFQTNSAGAWNLVYSERRRLNTNNLPDSIGKFEGGSNGVVKLRYNASNLPTRVTYYDDATASSASAEYRFYYPLIPVVPTSVTNVQSVQALRLAPNPAVGQIQLDNKLRGTFRILDLNGRLMMEGGAAPAAVIGIDYLTPGLYSILMTDAAGESFSGRFVKQ